MAFERDIWLVALERPPVHAEIRAFWNAKANSVFDERSQHARLWIGQTRADTFPGPAGRVTSLLTLRGTTPDYCAPTVTPELIQALCAAFGSAPEEEVLPQVEPTHLRDFLDVNQGRYLVYDG